MRTNKGKRTNAFIDRLLSRIIALEAENKRLKEQLEPPPELIPEAPICEECDEEMHRYGPALDTGKDG